MHRRGEKGGEGGGGVLLKKGGGVRPPKSKGPDPLDPPRSALEWCVPKNGTLIFVTSGDIAAPVVS